MLLMAFEEKLVEPTEFCLYSSPSMLVSHSALEYLANYLFPWQKLI